MERLSGLSGGICSNQCSRLHGDDDNGVGDGDGDGDGDGGGVGDRDGDGDDEGDGGDGDGVVMEMEMGMMVGMAFENLCSELTLQRWVRSLWE